MRKIVIGFVKVPRPEKTKNQVLREMVETELEQIIKQLLREKGLIENKPYWEEMIDMDNTPYPRGTNKPHITAT